VDGCSLPTRRSQTNHREHQLIDRLEVAVRSVVLRLICLGSGYSLIFITILVARNLVCSVCSSTSLSSYSSARVGWSLPAEILFRPFFCAHLYTAPSLSRLLDLFSSHSTLFSPPFSATSRGFLHPPGHLSRACPNCVSYCYYYIISIIMIGILVIVNYFVISTFNS
jgi:hypothetical protein